MKGVLRVKERISRKQAIDKITAHALYGAHHHEPRPKSNSDFEKYFRQKGIDPKKLIEEMRYPKSQLPYFENLMGSTWNIVGGMGSVINEAGGVEAEVEGPGQISNNTCESLFDAAIKARDRAVSEVGYIHVYECLTFGFASIEAYFNIVAGRWNRKNIENQLVDNLSNKASLETKIIEWIPILGNGKLFDRTNRQWSDFKNLKRIRDQHAIHPITAGQGMAYKDMANYLNGFRYGVVHLLGNLHLLLNNAVPAVIINAIYYPDVEVVIVK